MNKIEQIEQKTLFYPVPKPVRYLILNYLDLGAIDVFSSVCKAWNFFAKQYKDTNQYKDKIIEDVQKVCNNQKDLKGFTVNFDACIFVYEDVLRKIKIFINEISYGTVGKFTCYFPYQYGIDKGFIHVDINCGYSANETTKTKEINYFFVKKNLTNPFYLKALQNQQLVIKGEGDKKCTAFYICYVPWNNKLSDCNQPRAMGLRNDIFRLLEEKIDKEFKKNNSKCIVN